MRNETFSPDPCSFDIVKIRLKMNAESVSETLDAILSILLKNVYRRSVLNCLLASKFNETNENCLQQVSK